MFDSRSRRWPHAKVLLQPTQVVLELILITHQTLFLGFHCLKIPTASQRIDLFLAASCTFTTIHVIITIMSLCDARPSLNGGPQAVCNNRGPLQLQHRPPRQVVSQWARSGVDFTPNNFLQRTSCVITNTVWCFLLLSENPIAGESIRHKVRPRFVVKNLHSWGIKVAKEKWNVAVNFLLSAIFT